MPNFKDDKTAEGAAAAIEVETIAYEIGEVYFIEKDAKDEKERLKSVLFQAITDAFASEELAQKTVQVPEDIPAAEADAFVLKYHPGWRLVEGAELRSTDTVLIEEDPAFKQDAIIVEVKGGVPDHKDPKKTHPGYKVTKTVRSGSAMLDEERLKKVNRGLYDAIMEPQGISWIADMLYHQNVDSDDIQDVLDEWIPENWPLTLREDLNDEERSEMAEFTYEGPKSLALNVTYAKKTDF
jgi:hypothetical protein